jgi:hypothetical protein
MNQPDRPTLLARARRQRRLLAFVSLAGTLITAALAVGVVSSLAAGTMRWTVLLVLLAVGVATWRALVTWKRLGVALREADGLGPQ